MSDFRGDGVGWDDEKKPGITGGWGVKSDPQEITQIDIINHPSIC